MGIFRFFPRLEGMKEEKKKKKKKKKRKRQKKELELDKKKENENEKEINQSISLLANDSVNIEKKTDVDQLLGKRK